MKLNSYKYYIGIVFLMINYSISAQEEKHIDFSFLEEVYDNYNNVNSYQMDVEVAMYNKESELAFPKQKNVTIKSGNNFYIQTPEITTVKTNEFQLILDHITKEVRFNTFNKEQQKTFSTEKRENNIPNFKESESLIESIENNENNTKVIYKENPQYKKTIYTFNTTTKLLEKVDYYSDGQEYGQPAHISIQYVTTNFNKIVDSSFFELNKYIIETQNNLQLTEVYKAYRLINNSNTQQ